MNEREKQNEIQLRTESKDRTLFQRKCDGEHAVLNEVRLENMWELVELFNTLHRHSSDPDEWKAADYICEKLRKFGIPYQAHEAMLYLSIPRSAELVVDGKQFQAKTPSHSLSTGPGGLTAPAIYIKGSSRGFKVDDEFISRVAEKIVITDWPPMEELFVAQLMNAGAVGAVFVQPGERIHEEISTTIWGSPERITMNRIPKIPVLNVNHKVGNDLISLSKQVEDAHFTIKTHLDSGWKKTLLVVAEIPGNLWPNEFILLHGHLDSWHVGVGDNATGDASILEIARVFWERKADLKRSVRIAWWTGHSTGRYAGSTWYADQYALDLLENCVGHLNCDSPGCRWASSLERVTCQAELGEFTCQTVLDITGQKTQPQRPYRAGDYSFYNLGIPGTMMGSSRIPNEVRKEKGLYNVGGCGGNNEWHTEDDTLEIADREYLLRDTKLYAILTWRLANLPIHPLNFEKVASEIAEFARQYQKASGEQVSFVEVINRSENLAKKLATFYSLLERKQDGLSQAQLENVNSLLRRAGHELVEIDYTSSGKFHQDPAQPIAPLPDLAWVEGMKEIDPKSDIMGFTQTSLIRGKNRILYSLQKASELIERARWLIEDPQGK